MDHLTEAQVTLYLAGDAGEAVKQHASECPLCERRVLAVTDSLNDFRASVREWSARPEVRVTRSAPRFTVRVFAGAFTLALLVLLVVTGVRMSNDDVRVAAPAENLSQADAALLDQVRVDILRPAPRGLQRLASGVAE